MVCCEHIAYLHQGKDSQRCFEALRHKQDGHIDRACIRQGAEDNDHGQDVDKDDGRVLCQVSNDGGGSRRHELNLEPADSLV